jgi:outer membrane lipoprotein-sorting protein
MKKTLFLAALLLSASFVQAQNADEIVAKHLAAIGAESWAKINSIKMEANIASDAAAGMTITWNMTAAREKAARMDVSVMGMNQVVVVNGDKGWATNPFAGQNDPEPMTADQVESMKEMTDIDGALVGYKEKGYTVEYVGTEDVEGTEAIKIKINKGKKIEYTFFDPATYYEIKNVDVEEVDGKTMESATLFSNYKTQDGITLPFTMQQLGGGMGNSTITLTNVTFNPSVDDAIFEMPKK